MCYLRSLKRQVAGRGLSHKDTVGKRLCERTQKGTYSMLGGPSDYREGLIPCEEKEIKLDERNLTFCAV